MLKIKEGYNSFVLYDTADFRHHTHTQTYGIAKVIKDNIEHNRMPKSRSYQLLLSHFRVAKKKAYKLKILELINKFCSQEREDAKSV